MSSLPRNFSKVELSFPSSFLKNICSLIDINDKHCFSTKMNDADSFLEIIKSVGDEMQDDPIIMMMYSIPTKEISKSLLKNKFKCAPIKWHFSNFYETSAEEIEKFCRKQKEVSKETEPGDGQTLLPRKRGRPKNSTKIKLTKVPVMVAEDMDLNASTGRYSLRGAKLSSKIMKLEMDEADDNFESESDSESKPINKEITVNDFQKEFLKFDCSKSQTYKPIVDNQQDQILCEENQGENSDMNISIAGALPINKSESNSKNDHSELNTLCEVAALERAVSQENTGTSEMTIQADSVENITEEKQEIICILCPNSEIFSKKKYLRAHESEKHGDLTCLFCETSDKKYKHIYSLRGHVLTMHGENSSSQNHLCHLCSACYKSASTLKQHIEEIHEGIYKFQCDVCSKKFYRNSQLNRHKKIHGNSSMKLKCDVCGKGFWHEFNLQRHIRLLHNTQSEQFHCSYCGRPFSQKSGMICHVQRVHFNLFKFKCELCDSSFEQSKELVNHMNHVHQKIDFVLPQQKPAQNKYLKTPDEMFCCSSCPKRFFYKAELIVHDYSFHADTFPFQCRYCPQGFLRRSYLSRHRRVTHNEELSPEEEEELTLEMSNDNLATEVTGNGEPTTQGAEYLEEIDMNLNDSGQEYVLVEGHDSEDTSLLENCENVTYVYNYDKSAEVPVSVESSNEIVTSGNEPMMIDVEDGGQTIRYLIQPSEDGKTQTFKAEEFAKFIVATKNNDLEIFDEADVKVIGSIEEVETLQ